MPTAAVMITSTMRGMAAMTGLVSTCPPGWAAGRGGQARRGDRKVCVMGGQAGPGKGQTYKLFRWTNEALWQARRTEQPSTCFARPLYNPAPAGTAALAPFHNLGGAAPMAAPPMAAQPKHAADGGEHSPLPEVVVFSSSLVGTRHSPAWQVAPNSLISIPSSLRAHPRAASLAPPSGGAGQSSSA